jgi:hypothetical protein
MKLSNQDINVIRNFSSINNGLKFVKGNVIRTMSTNKTILAKAKLSTDIEKTFAIYDVNRFLGVISLFDNPAYNFGENSVVVSSDGKKVSYTYADPSLIVSPPEKDIDLGTNIIEINLTGPQLNNALKACGVLGLDQIALVGEGGKIYVRATNVKNPSSDNYDIEVGTTNEEFMAVFLVENMKLIITDYKIILSRKGIAHFKSNDVEYWIPAESSSKL